VRSNVVAAVTVGSAETSKPASLRPDTYKSRSSPHGYTNRTLPFRFLESAVSPVNTSRLSLMKAVDGHVTPYALGARTSACGVVSDLDGRWAAAVPSLGRTHQPFDGRSCSDRIRLGQELTRTLGRADTADVNAESCTAILWSQRPRMAARPSRYLQRWTTAPFTLQRWTAAPFTDRDYTRGVCGSQTQVES
jgi:hypothetical protein